MKYGVSFLQLPYTKIITYAYDLYSYDTDVYCSWLIFNQSLVAILDIS